MVTDIFVSYKKENRPHAERFAKLFGDRGFSVWWDEDITPDRPWDQAIEEAIGKATGVVVLWSPLSVTSDWVRAEAHYGYDHKKLVPVLIEPCELPFPFHMIQTVDLCNWDGDESNPKWRKLLTWIADLKAAAGKRSATGPAPANPFRAVVGTLASGEPIVEGAFVDAATPAGTLFRDHPDAPVMRVLPAGSVLLGGSPQDADRSSVELPQKHIAIARPFAMSVYPVLQAQYDRYRPAAHTATAPSRAGGWFARQKPPDAPVIEPVSPECTASRISFADATAFVQALSAAVSASYRLPSEAEWEYACRAGSLGRYSWGDDIDASRALYRSAQTQPSAPCAPGRFAPNAFGLYDMHGNVREWTADLWHETLDQTPLDGRPAIDGHSAMRVTRGGGWSDPPSMLRSSARSRASEIIRSDVIGIRIVRGL